MVDFTKAITLEFHAEDDIERKMLGLWADKHFRNANITMRLTNETVNINVNGVLTNQVPFLIFQQLAVKELSEMILNQCSKM